jgi:hypothetical protein
VQRHLARHNDELLDRSVVVHELFGPGMGLVHVSMWRAQIFEFSAQPIQFSQHNSHQRNTTPKDVTTLIQHHHPSPSPLPHTITFISIPILDLKSHG